MRFIFNILSVAAFACLGFFFYIIIKGSLETPTYTGPIDTATVTAVVDQGPNVPDEAQAAFTSGQKLFKQNCSSCHKLQGKLVGPALAGVEQKYADEPKWLYAWIKNSSKLIKQKDEKALAIWNEYNQSVMTAFPQLSDDQIGEILTYIKYGV
ncbi:MAG: cytochrome c [Bacteroidota bacterium]